MVVATMSHKSLNKILANDITKKQLHEVLEDMGTELKTVEEVEAYLN